MSMGETRGRLNGTFVRTGVCRAVAAIGSRMDAGRSLNEGNQEAQLHALGHLLVAANDQMHSSHADIGRIRFMPRAKAATAVHGPVVDSKVARKANAIPPLELTE